MCGIAGILGEGQKSEYLKHLVASMPYRGPDGQAVWLADDGKIGLGHVRLSIIDVESGAQPVVSPDGRYVLVFNGEIYNYQDLAKGIPGSKWVFRTRSDTEVLLAGLVAEGIRFLDKTIGMFAFALWDCHEQQLLIARDRMGIKPLYYTITKEHGFVFSSEFKSLLPFLSENVEVNPVALDSYLSVRFVASPNTMVKGIRKFPAGHWARFGLGEEPEPKAWWRVNFNSNERACSEAEQERLAFLMEDAVRLCMVSDVPFGSFLSGGVDSGLVSALMAREMDISAKTYSVGFRGVLDERAQAAAVAAAIGSDHHEVVMEPTDLNNLPKVVSNTDEPFPDPVILAMDKLALEASKDVKVILTGEGADEIFGGYVHHPHMHLMSKLAKWLPGEIAKVGSRLAGAIPVRLLDAMFKYEAKPGKAARDRLVRLLGNLSNEADRYTNYISLFDEGSRQNILSGDTIQKVETSLASRISSWFDSDRAYIDKVWSLEFETWLPDNILFKQDKILMGRSLEGRVPFCDHRLVEAAAALPLSMKISKGRNKIALRNLVGKLAPQLPASGSKRAFMVPMTGEWGLKIDELVQDYLGSSRFKQSGLFDQAEIEKLRRSRADTGFLEGKQMLAVLMFAIWQDEVLSTRDFVGLPDVKLPSMQNR